MKPTITDADLALARSLYQRLHEPGCGYPGPEMVAAIVAQARAEGRAEERAAVIRYLECASVAASPGIRQKILAEIPTHLASGAHVAPAKAEK